MPTQQAEPERALSALNVFAMTEALSAAGEALWEEAMAQIERDRRDTVLNRPRNVDL